MTFLATPPKLTEKRFQRQVVRLAEILGWTVWHDSATNAPRHCKACGADLHVPRNTAGLPDLLLRRRPRVIWAELKSDRGHLTDAQAAFLAELRACGQEAYVWRPKDRDTVIPRILR